MADQIANLGIRIDGSGIATTNSALLGMGAVGEGVATKLSAAFAGFAGMAGLGLFGAKMLSSSIESQNSMAQLEARVRSTGGAAGVTAEQMRKMAERLQQVTTFSHDTTEGAQAMLLSFTKIKSENFEKATEAVLNMAAAFGGDVQGKAIQLGKALDGNAGSLTALQRSGIAMSESQKKLVEDMFATNRVAEAQAIILGVVETKFGGAAMAARDTLGGALKGLKNDFTDLFEVTRGGSGGVIDAINTLGGAVRSVGANMATVVIVGGALAAVFAAQWISQATAGLVAYNATLVATQAAKVRALALTVEANAAEMVSAGFAIVGAQNKLRSNIALGASEEAVAVATRQVALAQIQQTMTANASAVSANALAAATTRMGVTLATAGTIARGAWALIGGPIGAAVIAAVALNAALDKYLGHLVKSKELTAEQEAAYESATAKQLARAAAAKAGNGANAMSDAQLEQQKKAHEQALQDMLDFDNRMWDISNGAKDKEREGNDAFDKLLLDKKKEIDKQLLDETSKFQDANAALIKNRSKLPVSFGEEDPNDPLSKNWVGLTEASTAASKRMQDAFGSAFQNIAARGKITFADLFKFISDSSKDALGMTGAGSAFAMAAINYTVHRDAAFTAQIDRANAAIEAWKNRAETAALTFVAVARAIAERFAVFTKWLADRKDFSENLQVDTLRAKGLTAEADALALSIEYEHKRTEAIKLGLDTTAVDVWYQAMQDAAVATAAAAEAATMHNLAVELATAQGNTALATQLERQQRLDDATSDAQRGILKLIFAFEDAAAAAAKLETNIQTMAGLMARGLTATGQGRAAEDATRAESNRRELNGITDPATRAFATFVQGLEDNAVKRDRWVQDQTAAINANLAATLAGIDAQKTAANAALKVAQDQLQIGEQALQATQQVIDGLRQFSDSLVLGKSTILSPVQQLEEARRQFSGVETAALGGDKNAAGSLPAAAQAFLDASRAVNASGPAYVRDFLRVQASIEQITTQFGRQASVEQQMLDSLNASLLIAQVQLDALNAAAAQAQADAQAQIDAVNAEAAKQAERDAAFLAAMLAPGKFLAENDALVAQLESLKSTLTGVGLDIVTQEQAVLTANGEAIRAAQAAQVAAIASGASQAQQDALANITALDIQKAATDYWFTQQILETATKLGYDSPVVSNLLAQQYAFDREATRRADDATAQLGALGTLGTLGANAPGMVNTNAWATPVINNTLNTANNTADAVTELRAQVALLANGFTAVVAQLQTVDASINSGNTDVQRALQAPVEN